MKNTTEAGLTSVVIVSANSGDLLIECISRALAATVPVDLILSDNASVDGSVDAIERRWNRDSRIRILRNSENLGFGAACNRAAMIARGDSILFLNPDCLIEPDTIARLRESLFGWRLVGLVGADIVDQHGRRESAARRRDPTIFRSLMTITGLQRLSTRWRLLEGIDLPVADNTKAQSVEAVSGALMLLAREAFERVGGFDEDYFLHCEDLDLCRRVRDAGYGVVCANDVRVVHLKGTSSRSRPFFVAGHKHRGLWRWFIKHDPASRNGVLRVCVWLGLRLHLVLLAPRHAWQALRHRAQR